MYLLRLKWWIVAIYTISGALCFLFADGEVTHNETGVKADHVDFGEDHWNQASGDHIPDSAEIDNIFGEHKGSLNFTHWGSEGSINFALGSGDEVEWDFVTSEAGDYVIAVNSGGADRGGDLHIKDGTGWKFLLKVTDTKEIYYYLLENLSAGTHRFLMRGFDKPYYLHAASWYKEKKDTITDGTHPRLLFAGTDVPALKSKMSADALIADYYDHLINHWAGAESFLNIDLNNGGWDEFGTWAGGDRDRADAMTTLALAYVLSGDQKYSTKCIEILMRVSSWTDSLGGWGRMAFSQLPNGGMLAGVSIAYDWVYDAMTATERQFVQNALVREAQYIYSLSVDKSWWWVDPYSLNNWTGVIHGGLGLTALVVDGIDDQAQQWVDRSIEMVQSLMDVGFGEEGAYFESSMYYGYAFQNVIPFMSALKDLKGIDLFPYNNSIMEKSLEWGIYLTEPNRLGKTPFDDEGAPGWITSNVVLGLARHYRNGYAKQAWDMLSGTQRLPENTFPYKTGGAYLQLPLTLVYYDPTLSMQSLEELPESKVWPKSGRACFRTGFENLHDIYFYMQCGIDGSHAHNDHGSFVLSAYNDRLVVDQGYGGWWATIEAHNLILIDNNNPEVKTDHNNPLGSIYTFLTTDSIDFLSASNKKMYDHVGEPVISSDRHMLFMKPNYFVVLDEINKDNSAHEYNWLLHTDREGGNETSHVIKNLTANRFRFEKKVDTEDSADLEIVFVTPQTLSSWSAEAYVDSGTSFTYPFLKANTSGITVGRFFTLLYPTNDNNTIPALLTQHFDSLHVLTIEDCVIGYSTGTTANTFGNISTDARFFACCTNASLKRFFMSSGKKFIHKTLPYLQSNNRIDAVFENKNDYIQLTLSCESPDSITIGSLLPDTTYKVLLNDEDYVVGKSNAQGELGIAVGAGKNMVLKIGIGLISDVTIQKFKPLHFSLMQNTPNPFRHATQIRYSLPIKTSVSITIYSLKGRLIRQLQRGLQSPGVYTAVWDGKDDSGKRAGSDIYLCRMATSRFVQVKKILLAK